MKLIVNADDFGYSEGVNLGIVEAHRSGIVTSTSAMITMPAILQAAELAKKHPTLGVGLHLNITCGKPLTSAKSLVNGNGFFNKPKENPDVAHFKKEEIRQEFLAQYEEFLRIFGRRPTHLDTHLYAHQIYPNVGEMIRELAREKNLPVRGFTIAGFPSVSFLPWFKVGKDETEEDLLAKFESRIQESLTEEYAELMVHPAYTDAYLMKNSSYNMERFVELKALTSERIKNLLLLFGIELTNYAEATHGED